MTISIYQVHKVLSEGTQEEVAQLQAQVAALDTQLQRVSQPLTVRKQRLAAMLAKKQQQLAAENRTADRQPATTPPPQQQPEAP